MLDSMDFATLDVQHLLTNPAFLILIGWLLKDLLHSLRKDNSKIENSLQENSKRMEQLTLAILELKVKLEHVSAITTQVPEMKTDLRVIKSKLTGLVHEPQP